MSFATINIQKGVSEQRTRRMTTAHGLLLQPKDQSIVPGQGLTGVPGCAGPSWRLMRMQSPRQAGMC